MTEEQVSSGGRFVNALAWYTVGVASILLGMVVLTAAGQVSEWVVTGLADVTAALAVCCVVAPRYLTKAGRSQQAPSVA